MTDEGKTPETKTPETKTPEAKPRLFTLPWFKPLYRRLILIAVIAAWAAWELLYNTNPADQLWDYVTIAALAYGIWTFVINFDKELKKYEDGQPKS